MKFSDSELKSVGELPGKLKEVCPPDQPVWFRGQSDKDWKLTPSLAGVANFSGAFWEAWLNWEMSTNIPPSSGEPCDGTDAQV